MCPGCQARLLQVSCGPGNSGLAGDPSIGCDSLRVVKECCLVRNMIADDEYEDINKSHYMAGSLQSSGGGEKRMV
jgi:hypothetical protein